MTLRAAVSYTLLLVTYLPGCTNLPNYTPKAGDIVFQDLTSSQSQAVKLATGSEYTHCGVVFEVDGQYVVYEAVHPVTVTSLETWIDQGVDGHLVARRLDTLYGYLTPGTLKQMRVVAESHLGKEYDLVFNWSDEKLYCSELVWKTYYEGFGLALTQPRQLASFNLTSPAVREKLQERYGDSIPLQEPVVSPADLFDSEMLQLVYEN